MLENPPPALPTPPAPPAGALAFGSRFWAVGSRFWAVGSRFWAVGRLSGGGSRGLLVVAFGQLVDSRGLLVVAFGQFLA